MEWNLKNIVLFEVSTLEFIKNEFLTRRMNFGIGSSFSKGPESTFLKGAGPGPCPLCKVCQFFQKNFKRIPFCKNVKKVFLKMSQNSQENTCARVSFSQCEFQTGHQSKPFFVALKTIWSYCILINITLRWTHVHQHPIERQKFFKST